VKKLLIISPYFPPSNAADMQRIRMSLPYFKELGWQAEVVTIAIEYSDLVKDSLLTESVPVELPVHYVKALPKKLTLKVGLGSIAIRSLLFYRRKVNQLLKNNKYDLIYFSTTQFPICVLGAYWKKKFNVPYVIDMQDPWHTEYYQNKPKEEHPSKYWFSYRFNKLLEPIAMRQCEGLISVSQTYIDDLKGRYHNLIYKPSSVITFGAFKNDLEIVNNNLHNIPIAFIKEEHLLHIVYLGVLGSFMKGALRLIFSCFKKALKDNYKFYSIFRFHFIGTSYAPAGSGKKTALPLAQEEGVSDFVDEQTDRVSFYSGLASLEATDGLLVPGTDDAGYTASKLYPYIMARKPLLGVFHQQSNAIGILKKCNAGQTITLNESFDTAYNKFTAFLSQIYNKVIPETDWIHFEEYTAERMAEKQVLLFQKVLEQQSNFKV